MNWRRGLFRAWIATSALWVAFIFWYSGFYATIEVLFQRLSLSEDEIIQEAANSVDNYCLKGALDGDCMADVVSRHSSHLYDSVISEFYRFAGMSVLVPAVLFVSGVFGFWIWSGLQQKD